jgi:hypothetical protein
MHTTDTESHTAWLSMYIKPGGTINSTLDDGVKAALSAAILSVAALSAPCRLPPYLMIIWRLPYL